MSSTLSLHVCIAGQSRLNKTPINPLWKPLETFTRMIKRSVIVSNNQVMQMTTRLTSEHHTAKDRMVPLQRAAVPSMVPELVLALYDPLFGALSDRLHQVRVELAQLPLLVDQARNVVADHPGAQRSDVPASAETDTSVVPGSLSGVVLNVVRNLDHLQRYHLLGRFELTW